jgi:phosphomethylpyrimidine synthase
MKITQDVRDYAAAKGLAPEEALDAGLKEKSEEFKKTGSEIYHEATEEKTPPTGIQAKSG